MHSRASKRLQLAAAACVQNDESGKARLQNQLVKDVHKLFRSDDGRKALEHAVQIEAKELLAQPVVQGYIKVAWRGDWDDPAFDGCDAGWLQRCALRGKRATGARLRRPADEDRGSED